ncbi:hypothetical protein BH11PSE3_BH11PSE3_45990 [soil metagenome]
MNADVPIPVAMPDRARTTDSCEIGQGGKAAISVEDAEAMVASLDLAAVKRKVIEDEGWSDKIADYAELRYRRFLCMHLLNPRLPLVPPPDIDAVWHQHILFTREYTRDCDRLFGLYLHHNPASGAAGEAEMMERGAMAAAKFYADTFGENYFATDPDGMASNWVGLFD